MLTAKFWDSYQAETISAETNLELRVTGGAIRGVREGKHLAWRGIPYAAPPVGHLRFRAPHSVIPWDDVRDASAFGPASAQQSRRGPVSEDSLTINITAPSTLPSDTALPVMVFIHGGGYSQGSSRDFSGQGESFVDTGRAVYASFNYRLGPFGYLDFTGYSTPARKFESNLGLRDQVSALQWIHDNIALFGGDPDNVTVFGESAGGNAVTTLLATPAAKGLFSGLIAQSAPPSAVYLPTTTRRWAADFVAILRGTVPAVERARTDAELLAEASVPDLLAASRSLQIRTPNIYPGTFCLAPVVDGDFLPEHPVAAIREGRAHRVPLIIGTNEREGSIFRGRIDILPRTPARIRDVFAQATPEAREAMHSVYPQLPARREAEDFSGEYGFWFPSVKLADYHSKFADVYSYRFDFAPRLLKLVGLDATHGVEMFALFDELADPLARAITVLGGRSAYASAGERMRMAWLRFAETGTPGTEWPRYDEADRATLIIDEADRIEFDPRHDKRLAWNLFLPHFLEADFEKDR